MELHLCGSRNYNGQKQIYWQSIRDFIFQKQLNQILFIGTASETHVGVEAKIFFQQNIQLPDSVQVLDAEIESDLQKVRQPVVYVLGGLRQVELLDFLHSHPLVESLIRNCQYYFGESAGAKIVGSKMRIGAVGTPLVSGLDILKDTIIEGHYSQKSRQQALKDEVKEGKLKYGLGIDEDAEVITTPDIFPQFQKTGPGQVELVHYPN
jgi:cyanophycinase-like exopeptidase